MKSLFYTAAICFAVGLQLNCGVQTASKSICELSEADAKKHLGETVFPLDKTALFKGLDSELKSGDPQLRACAYSARAGGKDIPYLEWFDREFESREQAKEFFETTFKNKPRKKSFDAAASSTENLSGIGDDAILTQEEREERRETSIIVRKGRNSFILKKAVEKDKAIPSDEMKSLAKTIADRIAN